MSQTKIFPCNDEPILREQDASGARIFEALVSFPADFMSEGREDTPPNCKNKSNPLVMDCCPCAS